MSNVNKPRAVIGVEKKNVPAVLVKAMTMYDAMNANAATFSAPTITMVAFLALIQSLSQLQQAAQENRGKVTSTARNDKRDAVWAAMQSLQKYVQTLANALNGQAAAQLIALAGLHVAEATAHDKPLMAATLTATTGTVHLQAYRKALLGTTHRNNRVTFNWEMSANDGQTWTTLPSTPYASTDVTGLTALSTYSFRVSVTIAKVTQPWSQAVRVLVY